MKYIDMHCDTLWKAWELGVENLNEINGTHADITRLIKGDCKAQFFAIFFPSIEDDQYNSNTYPGDDGYFDALYKIYRNTLIENSDKVAEARSFDDVNKNHQNGKLSLVLTMEDGRNMLGDMSRLEKYYDLGVRVLALTWNHENCFGFPNSSDSKIMSQGLKPFGRDAVIRMNELGMIIDTSHLSDGGFWDVVELTKKPFIASHSNCRALNPHPRSLTDEMIRALAEKGGCMGLNFASIFLTMDLSLQDSTVELMMPHLKHMVKIGGIECASIGTDLDGVSCNLEIDSADKMPFLFEGMKKAGFSDDEIEKIAYKNAERVMREVL